MAKAIRPGYHRTDKRAQIRKYIIYVYQIHQLSLSFLQVIMSQLGNSSNAAKSSARHPTCGCS